MKKSNSSQISEKTNQRVQRIDRDCILKVFRRFGYSVDITRENVSVLRQMDFPFRRLTLPNLPQISTALIRLYLIDLGIDSEMFYRLVNDVQS